MTETPFPDTPPQSTPASPTSPTSTEPLTRDCVVEIINDADDFHEGGSRCEKEKEMNEKIHATDVGRSIGASRAILTLIRGSFCRTELLAPHLRIPTAISLV